MLNQPHFDQDDDRNWRPASLQMEIALFGGCLVVSAALTWLILWLFS